jgi:dolichol-phosphate mannosyltransferase
MAALGFLSALQFFILGIIGEYLGRLYEESRRRPLFLEAERAGCGLALPQQTLSDAIL